MTCDQPLLVLHHRQSTEGRLVSAGAVWYGSEAVVDLWLHAVASKLATTAPTEGVVAAAS